MELYLIEIEDTSQNPGNLAGRSGKKPIGTSNRFGDHWSRMPSRSPSILDVGLRLNLPVEAVCYGSQVHIIEKQADAHGTYCPAHTCETYHTPARSHSVAEACDEESRAHDTSQE